MIFLKKDMIAAGECVFKITNKENRRTPIYTTLVLFFNSEHVQYIIRVRFLFIKVIIVFCILNSFAFGKYVIQLVHT